MKNKLNDKIIKNKLLEFIIKEQQKNTITGKIVIDYNFLGGEINDKVSNILFEFKINKYIDDNNNITQEGYNYFKELNKSKTKNILGFIKNILGFIKKLFLKPITKISVIIILLISFNIVNFNNIIFNGIIYKIPGVNGESIEKIENYFTSIRLNYYLSDNKGYNNILSNNFVRFILNANIIKENNFLFKSFFTFTNNKIILNDSNIESRYPCNEIKGNVKCYILYESENKSIIGYFNGSGELSPINNSYSVVEYELSSFSGIIYPKTINYYKVDYSDNNMPIFTKITNELGCYSNRIEWNNDGEKINETCLGKDNNLIENIFGYSVEKFNIFNDKEDPDNKGGKIEEISYLGVDGKLKNSNHDGNSYAKIIKTYDNSNNLLEERFFGENEVPIELYDSIINQKYYGKRYSYYQDNITTSYLDEIGNNLNNNGIIIIDYIKNKNNLIEITYRGKDLNPIKTKENIAIIKYSSGIINQNGIDILSNTETYFDENNKSINNIYGIHNRVKIEYSIDNIKVVKEIFKNKDGDIVNSLGNNNDVGIYYSESNSNGDMIISGNFTNKSDYRFLNLYEYYYDNEYNFGDLEGIELSKIEIRYDCNGVKINNIIDNYSLLSKDQNIIDKCYKNKIYEKIIEKNGLKNITNYN